MNRNLVSINQPYFFPYFGYFRLLARSDLFVSLDNVNMIKKGFVHRNYLVVNRNRNMFTVPLDRVSQNKRICQTYTKNLISFYDQFKMLVEKEYRAYPYYDHTRSVLEKLEVREDIPISQLAVKSIQSVCDFLEIDLNLVESSSLDLEGFFGQQRIIEICKLTSAYKYLNLPSGVALYNKSDFRRVGIELEFLDPPDANFKEWLDEDGLPLSILDTLSRFPKEVIRDRLSQ